MRHPTRRASPRSAPRVAALATCIAAFACSTAARADDAYCRKVRARAASDAALLMAPALRAEGVKLPAALQKGGTLDAITAGGGSAYQVRAGLTFSPLDLYKGFGVLDVGRTDCDQHQAAAAAQDLVRYALPTAKLGALRKQLAFLDQQRAAWVAILARTDERAAARLLTVLEADDVRARAASLQRKRDQIAGEVEALEAAGVTIEPTEIAKLGAKVEATALEHERAIVHVRNLDSWDVRVTGGYIPPVFTSSDDFFGVVQVSYNLGGLFRNSAENDYLEARREELTKAKGETLDQLRALRAQIKAALTQADRELSTVEQRVSLLKSARKALDKTDAPHAPHVQAIMALELITAEADDVFLRALVSELRRLDGGRADQQGSDKS